MSVAEGSSVQWSEGERDRVEGKVRSSLLANFEYDGIVQPHAGYSVTVMRKVGLLSVHEHGISGVLTFEPPLRGEQGESFPQRNIEVIGNPVAYEKTVVPEFLNLAGRLAQEHILQIRHSAPRN